MSEILILYILNKYEATIYKIQKLIDEFFFAFFKSSAGTINPALKRLENMGCVEFFETMSDGGMLSKTYSITKEGKKHLTNLLLGWESSNPYHILNEAKIILYCSEILDSADIKKVKENLYNIVSIHKIKLERGLENEYIDLSDNQKEIIKITIKEVEEFLGLL